MNILSNLSQSLEKGPVFSTEEMPRLDEAINDLSITSSMEDILDMDGLSDLKFEEEVTEESTGKGTGRIGQSKSDQKSTTSAGKKQQEPSFPFGQSDDVILETLEDKVEAKVKYRRFVSNATMAYNRLTMAKNMNFFEMLNIPPNANRKAIHKSFVSMIRKINPKGVRLEEKDQELLDKAVFVRDKLKNAYRTLMDPKLKRQYVVSLRESREEAEHKKSKAMILFNQGMSEMKDGNFEAAKKIFKEAVALDPNSPVYYSMLESIEKEERVSSSTKYFQAGILAYKQKNDFSRATKLIKKAISLSPGQSSYHVKLAEIQSTRPETRRDAIKNYEIAIDLDPGNHDLKMTLATFMRQCGMKQEAANRFQEVLKWNPDNTSARKHIIALQKEGIRPKRRPDQESEEESDV